MRTIDIELAFEKKDEFIEKDYPFLDMRDITSSIPFEERLEKFINYHQKNYAKI